MVLIDRDTRDRILNAFKINLKEWLCNHKVDIYLNEMRWGLGSRGRAQVWGMFSIDLFGPRAGGQELKGR